MMTAAQISNKGTVNRGRIVTRRDHGVAKVDVRWKGHHMCRDLERAADAEKLAAGLAVVPVNHSVLLRLGFKDLPARGKAARARGN